MGDMSATGVRALHPLAGSNKGPALCSTPRAGTDGDHIYSNNHHNHHQADITSKPFLKTAVNNNNNYINNNTSTNNNNTNNNMTSKGTLPLLPRPRKGGGGRRGGDEGGSRNPSAKGQPHASTTTTTTATTTTATASAATTATTTTTTTTSYLPRMSAEAQHAITETLKEMETGEGGREKRRKEGKADEEEEDLEEGWQRLDNVGTEEDDVFVQDDEGDDDVKSISSLPSVGDPLPSLPAQRRSWHPADTGSALGQSRENSLTFSQRTAATTTRIAAYRQQSRHGDQGSTLTAPARGAGRTPRKNRTRVMQGTGDGGQLNVVDLDLLSTAAQSERSSPASADPAATTAPAAAPRMHLPAITTSRTEPKSGARREQQHVRHVNYRIRGVGSYRVARENTFEITGPGFDVRYRDVISCQRGARDTPPPEIFEKSVGKVQEWLSKHYSPYSPS